ncbi:MAG: hypothetical protein Q4B31_00740 [Clostridia bacterium]|nr:hypothetical protein [Clostridia bacterium]
MKRFFRYSVFIFIAALILVNPEGTMYYAKNTIELLEDVLIPSLFPFFVCSGLLIYSGVAEAISRRLAFVMRPLFNINASGAAAVVLGLLSGYPLGSETAVRLYDEGNISKSECERLLAFCNNSGPLFIMGTVGLSLFGNRKAGIILYVCHVLSALTVGMIFKFYKRDNGSETLETKKDTSERNLGEIYKNAIWGSVRSIAIVSGTVLFFSVVLNLIAGLLPDSFIRELFVILGEVTSGVKRISLSDLELQKKILLAAAAAGFAGISVHLQVMSIASGKGINLKPYLIGKALHAIFAALYTAIALIISPITTTAFAGGSTVSGSFFFASLFTVATSLMLILLSAATMITNKIRLAVTKRMR